MTTVNFPDSPTTGQSFSASGKTWIWNGTVWNLRTSTASAGGGGETLHPLLLPFS